jgi:alpha-galactosidase
MKKTFLILFLLILILKISGQKYDLAKTPPMGWNSWNHFGCDINEKIIKEVADAIVSSGMRDAGYVYINIDDCWHGKRDSLGFIHPDNERFPSGIKAIADYVHSKGLKLGIYSDAGWRTCGGKPGSRGYEFQDAITYAKWGIDYLKYDWCNTDGLKADEAYKTMLHALIAAKRPIVFSICEWGDNKPWLWAKDIGHLWRTTGDIYPCFDCEYGHGSWVSNGILQILDKQKDLRQYAGPGHWNDPDMLEVGNGMSVSEDRAHFSLWCMLAAPLITGHDPRNMTKETLEILTNKEVIAVDQDSLGIQCFKMLDYGDLEIYAKPMSKGRLAICFLNRGLSVQKAQLDWKNHNIYDGLSGLNYEFSKNVYKIRNLWTKNDIGTTENRFIADVPPHDVVMLLLSPIK